MAPPQGVLDELRVRLGSPATAELPDAQLSSYLEEGLRLLSRFRPREATETLSLVSGTSLYDLPSGVRSVRRLYHAESSPPTTQEGPTHGIDKGVAGALAGLSPALDWPIALDARQTEARNIRLYGGDWYVEAGKIVIAPPPGSDVDVMLVYPASWTWDGIVDSDSYGAVSEVLLPDEYEDALTYGSWKGYEKLSHSRRKLRAVSRLGQSTAFAAGDAEASSASEYMQTWKRRVERPRVGPVKG